MGVETAGTVRNARKGKHIFTEISGIVGLAEEGRVGVNVTAGSLAV